MDQNENERKAARIEELMRACGETGGLDVFKEIQGELTTLCNRVGESPEYLYGLLAAICEYVGYETAVHISLISRSANGDQQAAELVDLLYPGQFPHLTKRPPVRHEGGPLVAN
jgi:hypothetical protein